MLSHAAADSHFSTLMLNQAFTSAKIIVFFIYLVFIFLFLSSCTLRLMAGSHKCFTTGVSNSKPMGQIRPATSFYL